MQSSRSGQPPASAGEAALASYLRQLCSDVTLVADKDGFFTHWIDQISGYISQDFVTRFSRLATDYDRIKMVWGVKPVHSLQVGRFYKSKDGEASARLREEGNAAFQRREVRTALERYSQAVTRAPHTGSSLQLAYGNRSAALCQLKLYRWCLRDLRLALVYHYPQDLRYKVLERAGHCYQQLHLVKEALQCYRGALSALPNARLDEEKKSSWQQNIEQKLTECAGLQKESACLQSCQNENGNLVESSLIGDLNVDDQTAAEQLIMNDSENAHDNDWKGVGESAPPAQGFTPHPALPSASTAVHIKFSPHEGRHAVAARDVAPGE
ncbi:SET and MYND domain-containing protein 4, partial [Hyalella azteca]|uniref:SET and MYND domain-containing protein 4 n=1 Tax=Hyalella azteca TaxID=294128 RepID=A0A8B7PPD4_HYAAZ